MWLLSANRLHHLQHTHDCISVNAHVSDAHWPRYSYAFLKQRSISSITWTSSNRVRQVGSVILQECISPPVKHTIQQSSPQTCSHSWTSREWRWPNKPCPHIMGSDSPAAAGEAWAFPLPVLLGISSVHRVTQPFGCSMAAGWQLRIVWLKVAWWMLQAASVVLTGQTNFGDESCPLNNTSDSGKS